MDKELIFYCRNGSRSQAAATMVTDEEITRKTIYHLDGGVMAWEGGTTAGFPRIRLFEDSDSPGDTLRTVYDLYRAMADRSGENHARKAFWAIAQAEKGHMRSLVGAIDCCWRDIRS